MLNWLLPEHISDVLPAEAAHIENLRRELLDLYRSYGYEMVAPPIVEYIDSLLVGNGRALNLRTCKLVDQLSGRTLGVRADITPQVARIDAHLLNREGITRLSYCGTALHARPQGILSDRELIQIGAEIFGCAQVNADIEIIELALASVHKAGIMHARVDLNHHGILKAIIDTNDVLKANADNIAQLLANKDLASLKDLLNELNLDNNKIRQALLDLTSLYGDTSVIDKAKSILPDLPKLQSALNDLETLIKALPEQNFSIDLADMGSGYGYHTGVVFSIYAHNWHDAIVNGGRYDGIGSAFGRNRAATGFSMNLRKIAAGITSLKPSAAIRAPWVNDADLKALIQDLRSKGEIVIQLIPDQAQDIGEFKIDREIVKQANTWLVKSLS